MDESPIGSGEQAALRFSQGGEVAGHSVTHPIEHATGGGCDLGGQEVQQRGLPGPRLAYDSHHLAFVELERNIAAAELTTV